jgi:eukaryotic-like serine/threonine-protein kinase
LKTGKKLLLSTAISAKLELIIRSDGSRVLFENRSPSGIARFRSVARTVAGGGSAVYAVSFSGGDLEKLCDHCGYPWDWSAEQKRILFWDKGETSVRAAMLNLETGKRSVFLERPGIDLYTFRWSPDGRWIAFQAQQADKSRLYVAPFTGDRGPSESIWIPITEGSAWDFSPDWSPDGNWIYSLSDRDGFTCVWAHHLDPDTKRPAGAPVGVFHSHGLRLSLRNDIPDTQGVSVANDKVVFSQGEITGNIWMTTLPAN